MKSNIFVTGGTGKTGRKVVEKLNLLDQNVRIGSRSAIPPFDWQKPEGWKIALEQVDKIYLSYYPDLAVPGAYEAIAGLIEEAKKQSVKKIVLLSGKGEVEAQSCEQLLVRSGINYTILRASWFMQNFSESFLLEPILKGQVCLPQESARIPFVDTDDIAEAATVALMSNKHDRQIYELTGPRLLTFKDVVNEIASASSREISFVPIGIEEYRLGLLDQGLPEDFVFLITYLFSVVLDEESNQLISHDIEKILGRKAKDFSEYAQKTAGTGVWSINKKV